MRRLHLKPAVIALLVMLAFSASLLAACARQMAKDPESIELRPAA